MWATLPVMKEFRLKLNIVIFLCICMMKHQKRPSKRFVAVAENRDASVWHNWCTETLSVALLCDYSWEGIRHLKLRKILLYCFFLDDSEQCIERKYILAVTLLAFALLE